MVARITSIVEDDDSFMYLKDNVLWAEYKDRRCDQSLIYGHVTLLKKLNDGRIVVVRKQDDYQILTWESKCFIERFVTKVNVIDVEMEDKTMHILFADGVLLSHNLEKGSKVKSYGIQSMALRGDKMVFYKDEGIVFEKELLCFGKVFKMLTTNDATILISKGAITFLFDNGSIKGYGEEHIIDTCKTVDDFIFVLSKNHINVYNSFGNYLKTIEGSYSAICPLSDGRIAAVKDNKIEILEARLPTIASLEKMMEEKKQLNIKISIMEKFLTDEERLLYTLTKNKEYVDITSLLVGLSEMSKLVRPEDVDNIYKDICKTLVNSMSKLRNAKQLVKECIDEVKKHI